jgi:hypothetical protein
LRYILLVVDVRKSKPPLSSPTFEKLNRERLQESVQAGASARDNIHRAHELVERTHELLRRLRRKK